MNTLSGEGGYLGLSLIFFYGRFGNWIVCTDKFLNTQKLSLALLLIFHRKVAKIT